MREIGQMEGLECQINYVLGKIDEDFYVMIMVIKQWLVKGYGYDSFRIVGVWRILICRVQWDVISLGGDEIDEDGIYYVVSRLFIVKFMRKEYVMEFLEEILKEIYWKLIVKVDVDRFYEVWKKKKGVIEEQWMIGLFQY